MKTAGDRDLPAEEARRLEGDQDEGLRSPDRGVSAAGRGSAADAEASGAPEKDREPTAVEDGAGGDEGSYADELESLRRERDEFKGLAQRWQANYENLRKRASRELSESADKAVAAFIAHLLPVLDDVELAMRHAAEEDSDVVKGLVKIWQKLVDELGKAGLVRIGQAGEVFDPTRHEAIQHLPLEEGEEAIFGRPTVVEVHRSGYEYRGKVVRPAIVSVKG
jgi:molecular chaperone GrpE